MVKGVEGYYEEGVMETEVPRRFRWSYERRSFSSCLKEVLLGGIVEIIKNAYVYSE